MYVLGSWALANIASGARYCCKKERDIKKYAKITESYKKEMMDKAWGNLPGIKH